MEREFRFVPPFRITHNTGSYQAQGRVDDMQTFVTNSRRAVSSCPHWYGITLLLAQIWASCAFYESQGTCHLIEVPNDTARCGGAWCSADVLLGGQDAVCPQGWFLHLLLPPGTPSQQLLDGAKEELLMLGYFPSNMMQENVF